MNYFDDYVYVANLFSKFMIIQIMAFLFKIKTNVYKYIIIYSLYARVLCMYYTFYAKYYILFLVSIIISIIIN